jgi:translocator protein
MPSWIYPAIGVLHPFPGALVGGLITSKNVKTWYRTLRRPWFTPPDWAFGPVWTTLYASMGYASYLVWENGGGFNGPAKWPLVLHGAQLVLNWAWTPIFFGQHKIGLAAVEMGALFAAVVGCIVSYRPISTTASNLMIPYLAWLCLAMSLNVNIWLNNKSPEHKG